MKKYLLILFLVAICNGLFAQTPPTFQWVKQIGSHQSDADLSMAVDASGNVYTTGNFTDTVDFDPNVGVFNLTAIDFADIFVTKFDASGNLLWAKQIEGSYFQYIKSMSLDGSNNIYITGYFAGTVDFDPDTATNNLSTNNYRDIFIEKLDSNGNYVWAKNIGGFYYDEGTAIVADSMGNVYTTGYFQGAAIDFDPGIDTLNLNSGVGIHENESNIFILKLDAQGNFVWAKNFERNWSNVTSIALDGFGNVYTTGAFIDTVDFDPGAGIYNLISSGSIDVVVLKLDSAGDFVWAKQFGGANGEIANAIKVDANGNVYTTGIFVGTTDFDPGVGIFNLTSGHFQSNYFADAFISKLDSSGNFIWAKSIGNNYNENSKTLALDIAGNIYTSGTFLDTVDFDPGINTFSLGTLNTGRNFILKLDATGSFIWAKEMGGLTTSTDYLTINSMVLDNQNTIYSTGSFGGFYGGTVDFDPDSLVDTLTTFGYEDIFIHKMNQCFSVIQLQTITLCEGQSITVGLNTYITSGIYTDTIVIASGCDSIVTTNLTVNLLIDTSINVNSLTISSNQNNATYQWIDCSNNSAIANATNQSFTATNNGNYAVVVSINNCSDTSACVLITTVGLDETSFQNNITIQPNPAHNKITISSLQNNFSNIEIINTVGEIVLQTKNKNNQADIDVSKLQQGVYQVKIYLDKNVVMKKFMKE